MEIWKNILGYEGLYQISNLGVIKSLGNTKTRKEKTLKSCKKKSGYSQVELYKSGKKKTYGVHRLVAQAYKGLDIDNPKILALHKKEDLDENGLLNNAEDNIFIGTQKDNAQDCVNKGRSSRGEKCGTSKLKEYQVKEIKNLLKEGKTQKEIGKLYGVNHVTISSINTGRTRNYLNKLK